MRSSEPGQFSSRGDGVRNPDIVAPGTKIQSLRVPGSTVDLLHGATAALGDRYFRGSGTSQSAAFVSGAVALLLQQRPTLKPDQVKALLRSTANKLPSADAQAQGAGLLDVKDAKYAATPTTTQTWTRGSGKGTLEASRGSYHVADDAGVELTGEKDIFGTAFSATAHASCAATGTCWVSGGTWNGKTWAGSSWTSTGWAATTWTSTMWSGKTWAGKTWAGKTWAGKTWADASWG